MTSNAPGLGTLLRRLLAALDGDVQAIYDAAGASFRPRFFPIALQLRGGEAQTVGGLAERCGVSQPAITQSLTEMRSAGLVSIERGPDRRARQVRLTVAGEALCGELEPIWAAVARAGAALDAELAAPLGRTIEDALDRLAARPFADRIKEEMSR